MKRYFNITTLVFCLMLMPVTPAFPHSFLSYGLSGLTLSVGYSPYSFGGSFSYGTMYRPGFSYGLSSFSNFNWQKMQTDTAQAIQLIEVKKQEYFSQKLREQEHENESREITANEEKPL